MNRVTESAGIRTFLLSVLTAVGVVGCAGLTKPFPQKNLFALSAGAPPSSGGSTGAPVLRVQIVRIAEPFNERTFFYKTGESKFTADYYNGFVAPPDRLLTGEITAWLSQSGVFTAVAAGSGVDHDLTLETNVTALYGDYSAAGSPLATIEAKFVLIQEQGKAFGLLFQKTYRESQPMEGKGPDKLVSGWEQGLHRMLEQLAADLQAVATPAPRPTAPAP